VAVDNIIDFAVVVERERFVDCLLVLHLVKWGSDYSARGG